MLPAMSQQMCARALLAATDGGESHDACMYMCVCFGRAAKISIYHVLQSHLPFCQARITSEKVHVPVREQFGSNQQLLTLEQLLLVQPVL